MMTLINNYRAMQGRTALSWDPNLNYPAAWMAKDMTITKRINHTDTFGRTPNQRFVVCSVPSGGTFAENVLIGPSNADEVFLNWQTTPTERTNMLDPLFNTAAVGVEYDATGQGYWVLVLAGPYVGGNVTRTPGSNPTAIPIVTEGPSISTVPSPNCLGQCPTLVPPVSGAPIGGGNPTPTIYLPPGGNPEPTQPGGGNPVPTQPANGTPQPTQPGGENPEPTQVGGGNPGGGNPGGGKPGEGDQGGIIGLFLLFLAMIIQFFLSLIGK
jgi:hypothetical protein